MKICFFFNRKRKNEEEKVDKKTRNIFGEVVGYSNVKKILYSMLETKESVAILLDGSAGTGKSMMLRAIEKSFPRESRYIDGSRMTKAGLFKILREDLHNKIKYLLIDEIDKLGYDDQESLLTLIEDGRIVQVQKNETFTKKYEGLKVIGASNDKYQLLEPLLTRFYQLRIKDYTTSEFISISERTLRKMHIREEVISYIIKRVLESKNNKPNIRDVIHIAKLCNNDIEMVDILIENSTNTSISDEDEDEEEEYDDDEEEEPRPILPRPKRIHNNDIDVWKYSK